MQVPPRRRRKLRSIATDFKLEEHYLRLLVDNAFLSDIAREVKRVATCDVQIAGIGFDMDEDQFIMYWNPETLKEFTPAEVNGVIYHELLHLALGHVTREGYYNDSDPHEAKLRNIAEDAAINSIINGISGVEMHPSTINPGKVCTKSDRQPFTHEELQQNPLVQLIAQWQPGQHSEQYYASLIEAGFGKKEPEDEELLHDDHELFGSSTGGCGGAGEGGEGSQGDDGPHSTSDSGDERLPDSSSQSDEDDPSDSGLDDAEEPEEGEARRDADAQPSETGDAADVDDSGSNDASYIQSKLDGLLQRAANRASTIGGLGWGNTPLTIRRAIEACLKPRVLDWRIVLERFIGYSVSYAQRNTLTRINKRYPYIHPGSTTARTARILIAMDQSGSVSDSLVADFYGALNGLTRRVEVDFMPFDHDAREEEIVTWKKGTVPKLLRTRGGGTSFDAPTNIVNDPCNAGRWDGMIILTDGEAPKPRSCKVKRGWVLKKGTSLRFSTTETVIIIDDVLKIGSAL